MRGPTGGSQLHRGPIEFTRADGLGKGPWGSSPFHYSDTGGSEHTPQPWREAEGLLVSLYFVFHVGVGSGRLAIFLLIIVPIGLPHPHLHHDARKQL